MGSQRPYRQFSQLDQVDWTQDPILSKEDLEFFSSQVYKEEHGVYVTEDQEGEAMQEEEQAFGMAQEIELWEAVQSSGEQQYQETQQVPQTPMGATTPLPESPNTRRQRGHNPYGRKGTYRCYHCRKNHKEVTLHLDLRSRLTYYSASLMTLLNHVVVV